MFYERIYTSPTSYTRACAYIWYHIPHSTLHTRTRPFFFLSYKIEKQCVYMYLLSGQQI